MQTQIKFIVGGANSLIGGFSAGDVLRCNLDLATHFVESGMAEYVEKPVIEQEKQARKPKAKE